MMPFLGPYTIRSGIGDITDSFMSANDYLVDDDLITWGSRGWRALEYRADLLDAEDHYRGSLRLHSRCILAEQRGSGE